MEVNVRATVWYTCKLDDDQARQVVEYMAENDCSAEEAVDILYCRNNLNLYHSSTESYFETEAIEDVIFDEDDNELLAEYSFE